MIHDNERQQVVRLLSNAGIATAVQVDAVIDSLRLFGLQLTRIPERKARPDAPLPCPFCGGADIGIREGSTSRWRVAFCRSCEAQGPESRNILGAAENDIGAIEWWNDREEAVGPIEPPSDEVTR